MLEMDLVEYFELADECSRRGISFTEYNSMMPWHLLSLIDIKLFRQQEEMERRKNAGRI
ncbi:hypothetical protein NVP1244A_056 [Vibrio phage 1.244.A._10N.261.54.C3]|nr:hypothetical protein NVP1244A_056 [Vibrio phage 1.244.A._10N.261.54.C3]AUR98684.1 hypothetical protein NVP1255O_056 [Vibrio phage 1.255.O._10N.286.45.F1]